MSESADPVADQIVAFLRDVGADEMAHAGGRSLLDHLTGTAEILTRWDQPAVIVHAALLHSVSGTEAFHRALIGPGRRDELVAVAGEEAEQLAHRFATTPRRLLFAGTLRWARGEHALSADEHDALLVMHMANLAEQARAPDGSPAPWLVALARIGARLDPGSPAAPGCLPLLAGITESDEREAIRSYRAALDDPAPDVRERCLSLAAVACPVVAEPCVELARLAAGRGDTSAAQGWASRALRRLDALGVAWDKRRSWDQWRAIAAALLGSDDAAALEPPAPEAGRRRFDRYAETLGAGRGLYPDLPTQPWFDPEAFALARYLERNADAIRAELLALSPERFHSESESIPRDGDWDVAFFYERGRRRDEICDACPVTTAGIEAHGTMRTASGLIYVSRMRPGTHIRPHRGPTNLRLRCHLGIQVPAGDCGIRVGGETRRWEQGRCLVFDDHFEHEAFNHTDEDRIVLIADVWHPALSAVEVTLLEGLQRYAQEYGRRLSRYWSANAAAAVRAGAIDTDPY